jgi:hypothetical protein
VLAEKPVKRNCCETAGNDQAVHAKLQIPILFLIFAFCLSYFKFLVFERIAEVSFLFRPCVFEFYIIDQPSWKRPILTKQLLKATQHYSNLYWSTF